MNHSSRNSVAGMYITVKKIYNVVLLAFSQQIQSLNTKLNNFLPILTDKQCVNLHDGVGMIFF